MLYGSEAGAGAAGQHGAARVPLESDGRSLRSQAGTLILVSNEIFSDGVPYDASMLQYLSYLGRINREAAALADRVTEVVYGIPVPIKREAAAGKGETI